MSQFMLDKEDEKQLKSLDKLSPLSENYKNNKRVNLEYVNEDELDDVAVDDSSSGQKTEQGQDQHGHHHQAAPGPKPEAGSGQTRQQTD